MGDEMTSEPVQLADGMALQGVVPGCERAETGQGPQNPLAAAQRHPRRRHDPLPAGGLWDETATKQQELF